jgi:hypothetical protein
MQGTTEYNAELPTTIVSEAVARTAAKERSEKIFIG